MQCSSESDRRVTGLEPEAEVTAGADESEEWGDPDPVEYNAFVEQANLAQIEVVRIIAERVSAGESRETNFETRIGFIVDEGTLHWRYDCVATIVDGEGMTLGVVEAAVVVTTEYPDEPPSPEVMVMFGNNPAALMAHPYLRETIATAAQRIGLPNVLLPMIRR